MFKNKLPSIPKALSATNGFSVVEAVVAGAVLSLIIVGLLGAYNYFSRATFSSGFRSRAVFLAEAGLEATRNLNSENFSNLVDGTYGISGAGTSWAFSGPSDVTDVFTRAVTISTVDANTKQIVSTVSWTNGYFPGSVILTTQLTKWNSVTLTTCAAYCQSLGTYSTGTCRRNPAQCNANGETREAGGATYCTISPNTTCCCKP